MNWKPYFARAGKGLAFFLIAALLFCLITRIFTPKWSGYWKSSDTVTGFYELDEDSIDTLIIGSSQVISGISPMELYQSAGISAYSLGTEQQPVLCSYYLLREALDTQPNLKAVIFEVTELFNVCSEASYRKGLDYLPLNAAKWEAIQTHVAWAEKREAEENGETAPSALSYVLPIIAYHDRWSQLEQADFTYWRQDRTDPYRGFSIQTNRGDEGAYEPLGEDASAALAQPDPEADGRPSPTWSACARSGTSTCSCSRPPARTGPRRSTIPPACWRSRTPWRSWISTPPSSKRTSGTTTPLTTSSAPPLT